LTFTTISDIIARYDENRESLTDRNTYNIYPHSPSKKGERLLSAMRIYFSTTLPSRALMGVDSIF
jgi:hypothetical protein